ncbi:hypothetical protein [Agaricicola taiwanensis]|uniref:hypothetical protein n=1 Tax=Agaricicola taiwanensis TaxID=591372 RepID=UPI001663D07E|nr:hypothetical protein [Agaricicola taiwanensis]
MARSNGTPEGDRNEHIWTVIADLRAKGTSDQDILIDAIRNRDLDLVGVLIGNNPPEGHEKADIDLNDTSRVGGVPLHIASLAAYSGKSDEEIENGILMLELLIKGDGEGPTEEADIALLDAAGYSAYMHAAQFDKVPGAVKVAEWLKEEMNRQAQEAAEAGDQERVDELVAAGADPIETENPDETDGTGGEIEALTPEEMEAVEKRLEELDVLNMETDITDAEGNKLTVNAATIKLIMDKYEKGIEDGTYGKDSAQYKFYYGMRGMSDTAYGGSVTPYFENGADGGPSERWEGKPYATTAEDMQDIYDPEKLKAMFAEAAKDPAVLEDWQNAQDEAMESIQNKEGLKKDLKEFLLSDDFRAYLKTLNDKDDIAGATAAAQRAINAYAALSSQEEVDEVVAQMGVNDLVGEINTILSDPGKIEDQYWEAATADWAAMMLEAINRGIQLGRHGLNSLELAETKAWFEKLRKGSTELRQTAMIFKEFARTGSLPENISQAKLDQIASRVDSKWGTRGPIRSFFTNLNKAGAFSTAIGSLALAGSIYQLTGGKAFDEDHLQNMQIARGFLLFFGTMPEMFKLASPLTKYMGMGDTAAIFGSKSVQEIFKVDTRNELTKWLSDFDFRPGNNVPKAPIDQFMDKFKIEDRTPGGTGWKMSASVIKVLGAASFTGFGIVDAVLGGFTAKKGADTGDDTMLAQGIMQVFTGGFTTAAGVAMGLSAAGVTAAAAFISPLLLVAAVIGTVIIAIDLIKALIEAFKEDDKASIGELEFYQAQADLGVLQSDWSEKFEFLRLSGYNPGGNSDSEKVDGRRMTTKPGESVFDAYDWKSWLATYKANHKAYFDLPYNDRNGSYGFGYPMGFRNGSDDLSRQDYENVLNGAVSIYHDRINGADGEGGRTVPSLSGQLREYVRDLFKFYFQHINKGDVSDAAEWVRDQIANRIPNAYSNSDHGSEAKEIFENYFNKHKGKGQFEELGAEVQKEAYQGFENTLNSAVVKYAEGFDDHEGISTDRRQVPPLTGTLREEIKNLFRYYFSRIDPGGTDAMAAKWVAEQIRDRMGNNYSGEADVFWGYFDKSHNNGRSDFEALAREVHGEG